MNSGQRKKTNCDFEKDFFKLMDVVFQKTMEKMRKHNYIKPVTTEGRRNFGNRTKLLYKKKHFHKIYYP